MGCAAHVVSEFRVLRSAAVMGGRAFLILLVVLAALVAPATAAADEWWPHPADATWTYEWPDSTYNPTPTKEKIDVLEQKGKTFTLKWDTPYPGCPHGTSQMKFQELTAGMFVSDFCAGPPSPDYPVLCPQILPCDSALSDTLFYLAWGNSQVLQEPLLDQSTW